jgi:catechol 2,3-dioxygenase-like lactoylglutathione lyase family enzyme
VSPAPGGVPWRVASFYCAVMVSRLLTVAFDARDPARLAGFWAALLGREVVADAGGALLPGEDAQLGLQFVPSRTEQAAPNRLHLHLTSTSQAGQQGTVAAALRLGATHLDVGQRPEEGHVVLADPEGNALCVIEPGNVYLAGCGFLGEVACDGTRAVGLFWSAALGWPLVWDENEETAVQSPRGGTKVAWSGHPVAHPAAPPRQRFELTVAGTDRHAEADRLVALGATRLDTRAAGAESADGAGSVDGVDLADGAVVLADPDGIAFRLIGS